MNKPKNYPFVEPEVAILADKHHGFAFYEPSDLNYYYNIDLDDGILYKEEECNDYECYAAAPLYQTLIDWFREEHKIDISWMPNWEYQGSAELYLHGYEFTIQSVEKYHLEPSNVIRGEFYCTLQEAITKTFTLI